jgi:sugar phosphate isomerase/epimerase
MTSDRFLRHTQDRRTFLKTMAAASSALVAIGAAPPPVDQIGVQLYTVRDQMEKDFAGTLERVARIGYREVEFAGYFGRSPADVRALLARNKLTAPSTHLDLGLLTGANAQKTLDDARAIGHEWVTVAWLDAAQRKTLDDWKRIAATFNRVGQQARAAGLRLAYHNHDFEFPLVEGTIPLALLLHETDPAYVDYEMDVYWLTKAGHDPLAWLDRHPDRFKMLHLKDAGPAPERKMLDVGAGTIDWRAVLNVGTRQGVRHVFVEHDQPADPMASIRASIGYLAKLSN